MVHNHLVKTMPPPSNFNIYALLLLSLVCVSLGQPVWSSSLSILASLGGFALFWHASLRFPSKQRRFWVAFSWFTAVQVVQLSWLSSTEYMGPLILVVFALLCSAIGLQFAVLTLFVQRPLGVGRMLAIAGGFVWMEWSRLFLLTGFPWNPIGLSLSGEASIQFASLFGVYGLSFWVILTNLAALRSLKLCIALAVLPYAFSAVHQLYWEHATKPPRSFAVALVQTSLRIEEKDYIPSQQAAFLSPVVQWERILASLAAISSIDAIVLPEAALPWGQARCFYPLEQVKRAWGSAFGAASISDFPPLQMPFAKQDPKGQWVVSNSFWAGALATHFNASVIIGLDASEGEAKYNAAFHFLPRALQAIRYEKRSLVPIGEYIPLSGLPGVASLLAKHFGIEASFTPGHTPKIFQAGLPMGVSICSEETYGALLRESRLAGAELFVNLTNDAWFPLTRLPAIHFQHARLRAAENGAPLIRACNTGMTGAIDRFGKEIQVLRSAARGVLKLTLAVQSHPTVYTLFGDALILFMSGIFILRKKLLEYILLK